jgi:hypothetical protein
VLSAPREDGLLRILARLDREMLRVGLESDPPSLPLEGRKLHLHVDWGMGAPA